MKTAGVAIAMAWMAGLTAGLAGCSDSRPPYFNEQPTYSDPDLLDKPAYFHQEPVYDWNDTARPAPAK